jgi:hypothetical protein
MAKLPARLPAGGRRQRATPGKSNARDRHNRGWAMDLAPAHPLFGDIWLFDPRVGRVAENEIIALNNEGANSRRVA